MNVANIEAVMYELANLFLVPVLLVIIALFAYAFFSLGAFGAQYYQRWKRGVNLDRLRSNATGLPLAGFPLLSHYFAHSRCTVTELEVLAARELLHLRVVTRVAPMLGLVATMIPMGPALMALSKGDVQGISENLIVAFTAVIFGLVTASVTFFVASIKKQWLASELHAVTELMAVVASPAIGTTAVGEDEGPLQATDRKKAPEDACEAA